MAIHRALLLIADIGGYTRFMSVHRVNLAHAQDVIARLLETVIDATRVPLKLAKLEGDAALFYAPIKSEADVDVAGFTQQAAEVRQSFHDRQAEFEANRMCTCESCVQAVGLKLKFVAHVGEVAEQKVKGRSELAGVDVIVVHRMLKNEVPVPEYVLMTDGLFQAAAPDVRNRAVPIEHDFEGIGKTQTYYVDLSTLPIQPKTFRSSPLKRVWESTKMNLRAVPYILGLKKPCEGFHNFDPTPADSAGAKPSQTKSAA
jgi:hypothetical protein